MKNLKTDITLFSKSKNNLYKKEEDSITQYYHDIKCLKTSISNAGFEIEDVINLNFYTDEEADKLIFICRK